MPESQETTNNQESQSNLGFNITGSKSLMIMVVSALLGTSGGGLAGNYVSSGSATGADIRVIHQQVESLNKQVEAMSKQIEYLYQHEMNGHAK